MISFVGRDAQLIVQSSPLSGGMPLVVNLPARRETMYEATDPAKQHAQVLHSLGVVPHDLVVLPGGQYLGLVTESRYFIKELETTLFGSPYILLPCLDGTTSDWLLIDVASSSISQRVRSRCDLEVGPSNDLFRSWVCDDPPPGEGPAMQQQYVPLSVGAIFGER